MPSRYIASTRSVSVDIIGDRRVNDLPSPWYILGFHRLVLVMDNLGRCEADPHMVKAMVFPRNEYMTGARCRRFCQALHDGGLCYLYEVDDERYLQSPSYHRQMMSGRMERKSLLPPPDPEGYLHWLVEVRHDKRFNGVDLFEENAERVSTLDRKSADARSQFDENAERVSTFEQKAADGRSSLDQTEGVDPDAKSQKRKDVALRQVLAMLETCQNPLETHSEFTLPSHETSSEFHAEEKRREREGKGRERGQSPGDPLFPPVPDLSPISIRPSLSNKDTEAEFDHVVDAFHQHLKGDLSPQIATAFRDLLTILLPTTIVDAMTTGKKQLKRKPDWPYVKAILNNWLQLPDPDKQSPSGKRAARHDPDKYVKGRYAHVVHRGTDDDIRRGVVPLSTDEQGDQPGHLCPICHHPLDLCQCLDSQDAITPDL